jgi:uncharacterized metal-binding protein
MNENQKTYETVKIEKVKATCSLCEDYAQRQATKPFAILSCEGACLRGEISRRAANQICYRLAPENTARICLGGAFTKDTGQRNLVRNAQQAIVIEGCFLRCASRMMAGVLDEFKPEIIIADSLYELEGDLFGIEELPDAQIQNFADQVAVRVADRLKG